MISPFLFSKSGEFERYPYDPKAAKDLAGRSRLSGRVLVGMDCPNDRYVNDEAICQAVAAMLARVGVKVDLNAQPKAKYFAKILASGGYDTSFYLLGWTPGSFDSWNILDNLMNCRDEAGKGGAFNRRLLRQESRRADRQDPRGKRSGQRDALIAEAFKIATTTPTTSRCTSRPGLGRCDGVDLVQRADNQFLFRFVTKN
jgi:peptide/nickel transport system substrate-binding protein